MYPGGSMGVPHKKSSAGIIIAIVALLVVGGGVVAAVLLLGDKKDEPKKVAVADAAAATPDAATQPQTVDAALPPETIDVAPKLPDANVELDKLADRGCACADHACAMEVLGIFAAWVKANASTPGDAERAKVSTKRLMDCLRSQQVTDADIKAAIKEGGPVPPRTVNILIRAKNVTAFDVLENGKKVLDGPGNLDVVAGVKRTFTIKSPGYKTKTVVIDGKSPKVEFRLDKEKVERPDPGPGTNTPPPPPGPDCRKVLVDGMNKQCLKQYCDLHASDPRCGLE